MTHKVEDTPSIDMSFLKKNHYLKRPRFGTISWSWGSESMGSVSLQSNPSDDCISFIYTSKDNITGLTSHLDYKVKLLSSYCHLGGKRYWFECLKCFKRVGVLYFAQKYASCRSCSGLYYRSQYRSISKRYSFIRYLFRDHEIKEKILALRVTNYKGKPTRRYLSLKRRLFF